VRVWQLFVLLDYRHVPTQRRPVPVQLDIQEKKKKKKEKKEKRKKKEERRKERKKMWRYEEFREKQLLHQVHFPNLVRSILKRNL
jgi:hypothetical protein